MKPTKKGPSCPASRSSARPAAKKATRPGKPARFDRAEKPARAERSDRPSKPPRYDRPERPARSDYADRPARPDYAAGDRPMRRDAPRPTAVRAKGAPGAKSRPSFDRSAKPARFERSDKPVRFERSERPARFERPARTDRPARAEKPVEKVIEHTDTRQSEPKQTNLIYGLHAVSAAWLNPDRRCTRLMLTASGFETFAPVLEEAERRGLSRRPQPQQVEREQLDKMLPGAVHQGMALDAPPLPDTSLEDICRTAAVLPKANVVVLDQVTDPHNVGAILRSAAAFGALALIVPERNAPPLTGVLAKTACGAVDVVPIVRVNNLARALDDLKAAGFWTVGLAESGKETLTKCDLTGKIALVMGAEGEGLRRLTMERCDIIAKLPTLPPIGSLNVSNAAAVSLYEMIRQQS